MQILIFKKMDFVLILFFILLAVALGLVFIFVTGQGLSSRPVAVVSVDNVDIATIDINLSEGELFEIALDDGRINIIKVQGGSVSMAYANCPNGHCMRMGAISLYFQTIVCLPHRLIVEVAEVR